MKQNSPENYEPIYVYLTPEKTPIAYQNKVECLKKAGHSEKQAHKLALEAIELEIYYEIGKGLFAVEPDAVESTTIRSPYTGEELEEYLDEENKNAITSPVRISQVDFAYTLKAKSEEIVRNGLINFVIQNNGTMTIPEHENGAYNLCMLDMQFEIFYFQYMSFDGETLSFSGFNENNEKLNIDEHSLPDNGLLYIYDYLITGSH